MDDTLSNLGHERQEMGTSKSCPGSKMGPEQQINQSPRVDPCQERNGRKAGRPLQIIRSILAARCPKVSMGTVQDEATPLRMHLTVTGLTPRAKQDPI